MIYRIKILLFVFMSMNTLVSFSSNQEVQLGRIGNLETEAYQLDKAREVHFPNYIGIERFKERDIKFIFSHKFVDHSLIIFSISACHVYMRVKNKKLKFKRIKADYKITEQDILDIKEAALRDYIESIKRANAVKCKK